MLLKLVGQNRLYDELTQPALQTPECCCPSPRHLGGMATCPTDTLFVFLHLLFRPCETD